MENIINNFISKQVKESYEIKQKIYDNAELLNLVYEVSLKIIEAYKKGNKSLIAGNGGSAADAQHIAGEFVSKFYFDRPGLPSIALTTDTSILTAVANDYGYEKLFSRQIQALGQKGDVFIGITTSGNSKNIIEALKECKSKGITTICFTGKSGGLIKLECDYCICIPSDETPRIQEAHILIGHIVCSVVEEAIFGNNFKQ